MKTLFACLCLAYPLLALPSKGTVAKGCADTLHKDSSMHITAHDRTVMEWDDFSIGLAEQVRIDLPHEKAAILHRVTGSFQSQLLGELLSNGQVILVNPRGIYIGKEAVIRTHSFLASTFDAFDEDLFQGHVLFSGDSNEAIVNMGRIETPKGDVALIARLVQNDGAIEGNRILIGAGSEVLLTPDGLEKIVISSAEALENPYAAAIEQKGLLEAFEVFLVSSCEIKVEGEIQASGGSVDLQGYNGWMSGTIDVSAPADAGSVSLDFSHGVILPPQSEIRASSLESGNGGKVLVWGDEGAIFAGSIFAEGGPLGGDGGFVEVSSPQSLSANGVVSTRAPNGKTGTLLYDPWVVTISSAVDTVGVSFASPNYSFTMSPSNINTTSLQTNLSGSNVVINASSGGPAMNGTITLQDTVTWGGLTPYSLTLTATDPMSQIIFDNTAQDARLLFTGLTATAGDTVVILNGTEILVGNAPLTTFMAMIQADTGSISISGGDLDLIGGTGGAAPAQIIAASHTVDINITGDLTIAGGGNFGVNHCFIRGGVVDVTADLIALNGGDWDNAFIESTGSPGSMTVNATQINLVGGLSLVGTEAYIQAADGPVTISCTQDINVFAGTINQSNAYIQSSSTYPLTIDCTNLALTANGGDARITSSSGDITMNGGGNLDLTGGTAAAAVSAIASVQTLGGGNILIGNTTPFTNVSVTGGTSFATCDGSIATQMGGNIAINCSGSLSATSGGGVAGPAAIATGTMAGNGDINVACGPLFLQGNAAGSTYAGIIVTNGGMIDIAATGVIQLISDGSCSALIQNAGSPFNNVSISGSSLTLNGSNTGPGVARIDVLHGNLDLNIQNAIQIAAGAQMGSSAFLIVNSLGNVIDIDCQGLTITGNQDAAYIQSLDGTILIDGTGPLTLTGGSGDTSYARIQTIGGGNIDIGTIIPLTTCTFQGGTSPTLVGEAILYTQFGGDITALFTGDITIQSGGMFMPSQNRAGVFAAEGGGVGNVTMSGNNVTLTSGDAQGLHQAAIQGNANMTLNFQGLLSVNGGTGVNQYCSIQTLGAGVMDITCDGITLTSGTLNTNSAAQINSAGSLQINSSSALQCFSGSLPGDVAGVGATGSVTIVADSYTLISIGDSTYISSSSGPLQLDGPGDLILQAGGDAAESQISVSGNGDILIGTVTPLANCVITGGYGTTFSRGMVTTPNGGSITAVFTGDVIINGGSNTGNTQNAGFLGCQGAGSGTISLTANSLMLNGGTGTGINQQAEISNGIGFAVTCPIILDVNTLTLNAGIGNAARIITGGTAGNSSIAITTGTLQMNGGNMAANSTTLIEANGNLTINATGAAQLLAGTQSGSSATIDVLGAGHNLALTSSGLTLLGSGGAATIQALGGLLSIDGAGPILMTAGSANNTDATIQTTMGGFIQIGATTRPSSFQMVGGSSAAGSSKVSLFTLAGGDLDLFINGNISLTGGTAVGNCRAAIVAARQSGGGNIHVNANAITITGGGGSATNFAHFRAGNVGGAASTIAIDLTSDLSLFGSPTLGAFIDTLGASGSNITISAVNSTLTTGAGPSAQTAIVTTTGNVSLNLSGDLSLNGLGGDTAPFLGAFVGAATQGNVQIAARNTTLNATGGLARIDTMAGDITLTNTGNVILSGTGSTASVETHGSNVTITATGSILLAGASSLAVLAPTGDLLAIANQDISIGTGSSVTVSGSGSLTLVVDNAYPAAPLFGPGAFTLESGGSITAAGGGPVRIFTSARPLNTISDLINGVAFVPGPFGVDSNQERWGVYYFNSFFGGPGFTIFYKFAGNFGPLGIVPAIQSLQIDFNQTFFYETNYSMDFSCNGPYSLSRKLYFENIGFTPLPTLLNPLYFIAFWDEEVKPSTATP